MHDLTAQVTSSLLPFPGVTVDALGEDEITLDSVLHGKFTVGRSGLAWLACGPHLEVVHALTGERLSAYCFSGGGEHPPSVLAARDFSWLKRSGLLVGLEEAEGSVLCLYDLGLSRVVKAVVIPGRITAIEPLVSYGGASTSTQHLHQSLRWFFGIAAVVTDLGHVLLVDLCLDDLSCSQSELEASDLQVVTKSPTEIPRLREVSTRQGRHLCLQLNGPSGVGVTALQYISRTNQLAVGFSDGYLQLWNMKALKKEYHSQLEGGRVPVHAFTFQEPENDPRNCCYLWAVQSSQDLEGDMVSLRLLQLAFSERKCLASGKILYEGLEYCEERYSQELGGSAFPLRAQATNTRLLSCQTIEKFRPHPDRDDSMNEVASPDTSVSIFSWQVKAYGQGNLSTYIGVFDINRWYHAQMPDSLRTGESLQNCPYLAVWSLDPVVQMVSSHVLMDAVVHDRSLSRGLPFTCPPPEQYFNPTTYNFDATCLLNSGIVHLTCSGYQKETLSFLKKAAPCSSDIISTSYSRCLMSGLLSSRLADTQASSLSQEEQLDAILSTAVETSSLGLITGCIKQWTAEEQPGSALNLRYILDWAWNKVVQTKEELDGICAPLFDSSSNFTDPQTMQLLQHSQRLLGNLGTIFHCLLSEAQELTQKGLVGLINKNMVSSLISKYAQVVLWFCRTGLLPEGSDDDALQISRPFYTHSVISNYYTIRREELTRLAKGKWCADCLMIDGLVSQCGERLTNLWKRDEGGTGQYPPATLHALLDIYLLDSIDEAAKHAIVIYLLLDVMYSFPNKEGASVESFPTAFAIPIGLVKLVQGLWLLDHHDHQSSFELLLHPAASQCQFEWQHERVLQALMCQGQHSVALRYFHVTKPPIASTSQAKLCLSVLLHNRCLIEAWSLLRQHSNRLNMGELLGFLYESCQELGLIKELLKLPLGLSEQECLEKFLQGTGGLQNRELLMVHYLQQANYIPALQLNHSLKMNLVNERDPKLKERSNIRNSILDQYGKVLPRVQRKLAMERAKPYQHPYGIHKEVSRPQPLSTITKRSTNEKVMSRAGFINNVLTKIEEVWLGKGPTPQSSPAKSSPRTADVQSPKPSSSALPDPFLGTPITMTSKRKSRLMDLVVQPSCQTPRSLLSPPSSWVSPKSTSKAPELSLLQTPQVVKRARALAASGPVFSAFTPQSILRSSLRPTPVATPSASPGRSITPPLRSKESRITFIEKAESPEPEKGIRWTNGMAADSEISLLTRGPSLSKVTRKTWSSQFAEEEEEGGEEVEQPSVKFLPPEGGILSPQLRCFESKSSSIHEIAAESQPSDATRSRLSLSFDASHTSVRSTDTTLEFFDAPLSAAENDEEEVVTINTKGLAETEEPEETPSPTTEQTPLLTSEDLEREEEEEKDDETFEDVMETGPEQEAQNEEVQPEKEDEEDVDSSNKQEDAALDEEETYSHEHVCNQVTESMDSGTEVECQDQPETAVGQEVQSEATESTEVTEQLKLFGASEPKCELEEELEQSTDMTEFVQKHLFGGELSPPLTRSGIHDVSQTQIFFNRYTAPDEQEEERGAAEAPPVFTSQKSTASVTSSEPTGTDSHSVVSLNDSEELSSPMSEDEEEDEDEESDEEEEEEDSGSEVEIIEEVQGNGRLPPLQPSSVYVDHGHFLPSLSEQEAAEFSLITPGADMKLVEEDMEGEVVMVRLGADEEGMVADIEEQGSSYMELKPSTTLLVPLELMEGQDGLVDSSQLGLCELPQTVEPGDPKSETNSGFSLMLDMDEDGDKDAGTLPMENDVQFTDALTLSPAVDDSDELVEKPNIIVLGADDQDPVLSGEAAEEEQRGEMDVFDGLDGQIESELADLQSENIEANHEAEDVKDPLEAELVMVAEDQESAGFLLSVPAPVEELEVVVDVRDSMAEKDAAEEVMEDDEDKPATAEVQEKPEENGAVDTDTEIASSAQTEAVVDEKDQELKASVETDEENREESKMETETKRRGRGRLRKQKDVEEEEQPVPETPSSLRKKKAASTPTRRTTRGRTVSFISPVAEEPQVDGKVEEAETSTLVPASPSRTPRKTRQNKESTVRVNTPRRSTRNSQPAPPKGQEEAVDNDLSVASTSIASSPARRRASQRAAPTQSSKSGSEEEEIKEVQEDEVINTRSSRRTPAKTPTPAKRRTTQGNTPRRSSRKIPSSSEKVAPTTLEILEEEKEPEEVLATPATRTSRKTKPEASETEPALLEEEENKKQQVSSPGRTTRRSNRNTLNVYPQVKLVPISLPQSARRTRGETVTVNTQDGEVNSLRRTTRKLWDQPEEDLPLLDSPLEVDSETPVADALIKRLKDEEEKQEGAVVVTKMVRASKRSTKSSVEHVPSLLPEPEADESSPGEHSFIYSPSRRRTRANRGESPGPSEESAAPVTRSRRRVVKDASVAPHDDVASEEDQVEVEKAADGRKTRKTGKRMAKSKTVSEPPPIAEAAVLSPVPSPADPVPRALKRIKGAEAPTSSTNLRRKRILDAAFPKPVTRRKKL
ncbi:protein ELYS [Acanthopagrus latus]|uniref:protein ELYS n=1 Tax=Acanthopagrus latus TaxID=8177 RepID=UPI00187BC834|nr:protein ELYS [Acanthopagrus latus]